MSGDDWAVGDLALCVTDRHPAFSDPTTLLTIGGVYCVVRVGRPRTWLGGEYAIGLAEVHPRRGLSYGWPHSMFRKIKPLSDEERDSFLADLREPVFASSLPAAETIRRAVPLLPVGAADAVLGERFHDPLNSSQVQHDHV